MYEHPPCRQEADHFLQIDIVNREGTLAAARKFQIDGVVTDQTDIGVPTVALVAEELGLPGIGFEKALCFTNKELMRRSLAGCEGFQLPESHFFDDVESGQEFVLSQTVSPDFWITKPVNSQGSRGVARLLNENWVEQLERAHSSSRRAGILLEEYIDGDEYSVESFVLDNSTYNLAVTRKYHYSDGRCIDERNTYLDDVPIGVEEALYYATDKIVERLKPGSCSMHTEYMVSGSEVFLMETAARGGGGNISGKIIPFLTGFEPNTALVNLAISREIDISYSSYRDSYAVMRFFNFDPGVVTTITYDQELADQMLHFELGLSGGSLIRTVADCDDRPGYFVAASSNRETVLTQEALLLESVVISYT
jgi:carbamoyl-phosphate synthase large subunit